MGWVFLWLVLGLATGLWLCFRVARSSVPLAIATFLLGPVGAAYTLFKEHGEEDTSVTVPFIANMVCIVLLLTSGWSLLMNLMQGAPDEMVAAMAQEADAAPAALAGLAEPALTQVNAVASTAPARDPIDTLAADLRRVGVQSTVLRLPPTTKLPDGVVAGAQLAMSSLPGAGEWINDAPVPSAPAGRTGQTEIAALFLRCDAAVSCSGVARAYMAQDAVTRPRVLQNGTMLLLMSDLGAADTGRLHNVVASTFRHLPAP